MHTRKNVNIIFKYLHSTCSSQLPCLKEKKSQLTCHKEYIIVQNTNHIGKTEQAAEATEMYFKVEHMTLHIVKMLKTGSYTSNLCQSISQI